jgi:chlorophyll/bacteriochlorophyll a synthase
LAARTLPDLRAVLTLFKPVTWFPPMWAFLCGAVSSGASPEGRWFIVGLGVVVAGPLVCATSQVVNDWYDREVDAINEPQRPIPSGQIPGHWGFWLAVSWTFLSAGAGWFLGTWGFIATLLGLFLAWAYSAPPLRFKQNGWIGNLAVGLSYEGLAWVTGAAVLLGGQLPSTPILVIALLYSLGTHGIMTLNDFKSMDGDRRMGVHSLPASLGAERAAWVAAGVMVAAQIAVLLLMALWGRPIHVLGIGGLLLIQLPMLQRFLASPEERALWYSGFGVPFFVLGMMIAAFALRGGAG